MGDGFNISKVTPPPIKGCQIPPTEGSFPLPKYPKQGLGRVEQSSTSNIQYEFLLHNWLKLALRWLSTLGGITQRLKKPQNQKTPVFTGQTIFGGTTWNWKRVICAVLYTPLPLDLSCRVSFTESEWITAERRQTCWCLEQLSRYCGRAPLPERLESPPKCLRDVAVRSGGTLNSTFQSALSETWVPVMCSNPEGPQDPLCQSCLLQGRPQATPELERNPPDT